jgi:hypothetical protein
MVEANELGIRPRGPSSSYDKDKLVSLKRLSVQVHLADYFTAPAQ